MRKLKLELGELRVESFEATVSRLENPGTVRANEDTVRETVCYNTHQFDISCRQTCTIESALLSVCGSCPQDLTCGHVCIVTA